MPLIKYVKILSDFKIEVVFEDGYKVFYDVKDYINSQLSYSMYLEKPHLFHSFYIDSSKTKIYWNDDFYISSDNIYTHGDEIIGNKTFFIEVTSIKILSNKTMLVTFNTNETKIFNCDLLSGPAFERLKNDAVLKDVKIVHGVPTWLNGEIDIAPEFVYQNSSMYIPF
ncbi:MAG: DUF2442 domain-containing protein [Paludibacteraceae bacterium]|nr:DUF2442 domain-containing protein [Paludibacteraceae bacterium]